MPATEPTRYFAFLRAINVGGHTVKMDRLRTLFEELGHTGVESFIASGNVIFESPNTDTQALERQIEVHLHSSLGFEVATFIRSATELAGIAAYQPFEDPGNHTVYVSFASDPPDAAAREKLAEYQSPDDEFHIHEREIYWLTRKKISQSTFSGATLEKVIGMPSTMRNINTVHRLVSKYLPM